MLDFDGWMNRRKADSVKAAEDVIEAYLLTCAGCGKTECITYTEYESGDTGWYSDDPESGTGFCGCGPHCIP